MALPFSLLGKHVTLPHSLLHVHQFTTNGNSTTLPWLTQASIIYHYQHHLSNFQPGAQMKRIFHENKLNPVDDETIAEFSRNCPAEIFEGLCWSPCSNLPEERQSQELKVKDSKHSSWSKVTTTLNERNTRNTVLYFLVVEHSWTHYTWYIIESCLRGRRQGKWHI